MYQHDLDELSLFGKALILIAAFGVCVGLIWLASNFAP